MKREERRRDAEALDRYWDAIVSGSQQGAPAEIGETPAELIRHLQALGGGPELEAAQARIWKHLTDRPSPDMKEMPMMNPEGSTSAWPITGPNGRVNGQLEPRPRLRAAADRRRWMMTQFATAALVLVTVVASLVVFGPLRPGSSGPPQGQQLAAIAVGTPEAGQFEFLWRSTGGPDSIDNAYGLGIDPEGNVWVAEGNKDRFQIIAPDGTYRETWGTPGSGDGEFEFLSTAAGFGRAYGDIAFDAEGNLYVADTGNFRVQKFAPDRTFLQSWGSKGKGDGQFLAASGIAIGGDGVVYVSDESRADVQMFDPEGQYLGAIGEFGTDDGQFSVPGGVTVDATGDIWVADWGSKQIQRFTSSGDWLDTWGQSGSGAAALRNPNDVAVDDLGRVYVVADFSSQLHAFSADGRLLAVIGGFGSGPGQFNDPLGIAVGKDRTVYVSDLNGVQAFRLLGS